MRTKYIEGHYQGQDTEVIDEFSEGDEPRGEDFDDYVDRMLGEWRMAFGYQWMLWIREVKEAKEDGGCSA